MNRAALVEKVAAAEWKNDTGEDWPPTTAPSILENYRRHAASVLDAILPQVTTVAELEALPVGVNLIGTDAGGRPEVWTVSADMHRFAEAYLRAYGPFIVWQPEVAA